MSNLRYMYLNQLEVFTDTLFCVAFIEKSRYGKSFQKTVLFTV